MSCHLSVYFLLPSCEQPQLSTEVVGVEEENMPSCLAFYKNLAFVQVVVGSRNTAGLMLSPGS